MSLPVLYVADHVMRTCTCNVCLLLCCVCSYLYCSSLDRAICCFFMSKLSLFLLVTSVFVHIIYVSPVLCVADPVVYLSPVLIVFDVLISVFNVFCSRYVCF